MRTGRSSSTFDARQVRGLLAEREISHSSFAAACGLSRTFISHVLHGHPVGELAQRKLADGVRALGLELGAHDAAS
jgi:hypothetical protein